MADLRPGSLYLLRGLDRHPVPYIDTRIEYPVLTGVFMTTAAALTNGIQDFLRLNSVLLVYSLANWDLFAILLMLLGWRAHLRQRHAAAGIWLALGVFAKLFPIFLLGACMLELIRRWHTRRDRRARAALTRFSTAALATSTVVNLPFALPAFHNWLWFWTFNERRDGHADLLSWLHILNTASVTTTNRVLTAITLVVLIAGALAIWRGTPVAHAAAFVFLAFMLLNKIYSPQYTSGSSPTGSSPTGACGRSWRSR